MRILIVTHYSAHRRQLHERPFGNVLGCHGSVLTTLSAQVATGGPVTVTRPEVTRHSMAVDEPVQLVLLGLGSGPGPLREVLAQSVASSGPRAASLASPVLEVGVF